MSLGPRRRRNSTIIHVSSDNHHPCFLRRRFLPCIRGPCPPRTDRPVSHSRSYCPSPSNSSLSLSRSQSGRIPRNSLKPSSTAGSSHVRPCVASHVADRFYCPPLRRHLLHHHHHHQASKAAAAAVERQPRSAAAAAKEEEEETNLECFIASTAVRVPAHRLPRVRVLERRRRRRWIFFF